MLLQELSGFQCNGLVTAVPEQLDSINMSQCGGAVGQAYPCACVFVSINIQEDAVSIVRSYPLIPTCKGLHTRPASVRWPGQLQVFGQNYWQLYACICNAERSYRHWHCQSPSHNSLQQLSCKSSGDHALTLQGLQPMALHMRTTSFWGLAVRAWFSSSSECICTVASPRNELQ